MSTRTAHQTGLPAAETAAARTTKPTADAESAGTMGNRVQFTLLARSATHSSDCP
ncbi:MAG: hypothetical protein HC767_02505 [Akkermansiaceae bacterium]|nr:hypothetical protein [Akkermansiaceae bacterium]